MGGPAMLTLNELSQHVVAYRDGQTSFAEFENWFEDNSAGAYEASDLRDACIAVDAALAQFHFDHVEERVLKSALETAVRPFALRSTDRPASSAVLHSQAGSYRIQVWISAANNSNVGENAVENTAIGSPAQSVGSNSTYGFIPAEA
jgi:hypothetical protein